MNGLGHGFRRLWSADLNTCLIPPSLSPPRSSLSAVEMAVRGLEYLVFINPSRVPELTALEVTEAGLLVGAACPLSEVGRRMQELVDQLPGAWCSSGIGTCTQHANFVWSVRVAPIPSQNTRHRHLQQYLRCWGGSLGTRSGTWQ